MRQPNALTKTIRRGAEVSITARAPPLGVRKTHKDLGHFRYGLAGRVGFEFFTLDGGEKRTSAQLRAEAKSWTETLRSGRGVVPA